MNHNARITKTTPLQKHVVPCCNRNWVLCKEWYQPVPFTQISPYPSWSLRFTFTPCANNVTIDSEKLDRAEYNNAVVVLPCSSWMNCSGSAPPMSNNFNKPGQQKQASKHVVFKINQCQF